MEPLRRAAKAAAAALGYQAIMAEDFGARTSSPQIACLDGLRQADVVVLILGDRYGAVQPSGLSATHEEYREAKDRKPILAFVQEGINPEPAQTAFISEVQHWQGGLFRGAFVGPDDLQPAITRALHEWQLTNAVGSLDPQELLTRALALMPRERAYIGGTNSLRVSIVGGPAQSILRPAEIEDPALADELLQTALFGDHRIFDPAKGSSKAVIGHALVLEQEQESARISLDEQGALFVSLSIEPSRHGLPVLIEESVQSQLTNILEYAGWLLERIDPTYRLSQVVIAVSISGSGALSWRTQSEHAARPNESTVRFNYGGESQAAVSLNPPNRHRASLRLDTGRLVQDFVVLLRRQWKA